ncbi:hypothetical protein GPJ56_000558 [Histomonas meleagridis]|uniref:uncharacterized protein n=1 Tax=Histomonas meleagridis TaxID=135588 RepID=UPI003559B409|nr:hypothetical protein GPJ56_000558 [Histomonas meleagridis]KAH0796402.1 hypothetical protein GO595_010295 [Histomonas meleagridis]
MVGESSINTHESILKNVNMEINEKGFPLISGFQDFDATKLTLESNENESIWKYIICGNFDCDGFVRNSFVNKDNFNWRCDFNDTQTCLAVDTLMKEITPQSGLSKGAIAAIVIVSIIVVAGIAFGAYLFIKKKTKKKEFSEFVIDGSDVLEM